MKETKTMLLFCLVTFITWMVLSLIVWWCAGFSTFREASTFGGTGMLMLIFGWIPGGIVIMDYQGNY
jgi:hypothetical protein